MLLTSRMEGLPLVLLEAMSVGCIPIAYDMPYGPADIIVDGVNGYLVEAGDIEGWPSRSSGRDHFQAWKWKPCGMPPGRLLSALMTAP